MLTKEQITKAVSDIYTVGDWIFLYCTQEYSWVPDVVNDYVKVYEELAYENGQEPEEDSRMHMGIRVFARPRNQPGEGKVFVLGEVTDKNCDPKKLAITDHYFTWLNSESTAEMMLFFGEIHGELAAMLKDFPGNIPLFFVDIEGPEIIKHFPELRTASPDLADPQFPTSGWVSSVRNDYCFYSYRKVSSPPVGPPGPPTPTQQFGPPIPPGGSPEPVREPQEKPAEPQETPYQRRLRRRAMRYDPKYRQ